MVPSNSR